MQFVEQLAGRASPPTYDPCVDTEHREADHDLSSSVPQERVDSQTLKALEHLLGGKGLQFLAAFLRLAEAKQQALAGLGVVDCAVITTKTIRALAKRIGWGYDTTEKYLVVLCALHFLHKEKSADGITYFFPLHRYIPQRATLDALEGVIGNYRPKVQSFARKAKRRFLVYLEQQKSPVFSLPLPASRPFDLSGVEGDIEQIMQEELGAGLLPQRLLGKIKSVLRYRCQATPIQNGDSDDGSTPHEATAGENGDFSASTIQHESPFLQTGDSSAAIAPQTGDSLSAHPETTCSEKSPFPGQSGDFSASTLHHESPVSEQKGDSLSAHDKTASPQKSPVSAQKGDSHQGPSPANGRLSPQSRPFPVQTGDFSSEPPPNVNVISNILLNLNVNVKGVIEYLRTTFDEEPKKRGFYYSLYKQYQQPDAWLAAAIETLLAYHKQKTQQPGKYFYDLCVLFHKNGIPQEVAERVQQYGHLTHEQLLVALVHPPVSATPSPTMRSTATRPSQSQRPQLVPHIPREKDRRGLTGQELQQVIELIRSDLRTCTVGIARYQQTDGSSALLIDNGSTKYPRQVWIYTVGECQARFSRMKLRNDFFLGERSNEQEIDGKDGTQ
jgi:hypothetical protein